MHCPEFEKFGSSECMCMIADTDETFFGVYYVRYGERDYEKVKIPDDCPFKMEQDMTEWNDGEES